MPDHKESLLHLAGQLHRRLSAVQRDALAPLGLLPAQFTALAEIAQREGLTQAELAVRLDVEQPGVARTLSGLEAGQWIERSALKGRAQGLYLSQKSRDVLPRAQAANTRAESRFLAGLSRTEAAQFLDQLAQLVASTRDTN